MYRVGAAGETNGSAADSASVSKSAPSVISADPASLQLMNRSDDDADQHRTINICVMQINIADSVPLNWTWSLNGITDHTRARTHAKTQRSHIYLGSAPIDSYH